MDDRDILDQIDDVIVWDGHSADAMVWTAEPPKQFTLPTLPRLDPESAQRFMEHMTRQTQAFMEALRPVAEQMRCNTAAIAQAFTQLANDPGMRAAVEAYERGEIEPDLEPCHCLCVAAHRDQENICAHDAVDSIVRVSPMVGRVEIDVCAPCRDAQLVSQVT
jgi:hypothetical protein